MKEKSIRKRKGGKEIYRNQVVGWLARSLALGDIQTEKLSQQQHKSSLFDVKIVDRIYVHSLTLILSNAHYPPSTHILFFPALYPTCDAVIEVVERIGSGVILHAYLIEELREDSVIDTKEIEEIGIVEHAHHELELGGAIINREDVEVPLSEIY